MKPEAQVSAEVSLEYGQKCNGVLWRNNVGVTINKNGQPVRYGLANETKQMNKEIKSGDKIGWTNVEITPEMVGHTLPIFTSIEVKKEGYKPQGKAQKEHMEAQERWRDRLSAHNCIAGIVDSAEKAVELFREWLRKFDC